MTKFYNISTDATLGETTTSDNIVVSQKAIKTYVDNKINTKQDLLVSGVNIKSINNESILGGGECIICDNGTVNAITSLNNVTTDLFVTNVYAKRNALQTITITPTNGSINVNSVNNVSKSNLDLITLPTLADVGTPSSFNFTITQDIDGLYVLVISGDNSTVPTQGLQTVATGTTSNNGAGASIVSDVTYSLQTVAKPADVAVNVATGKLVKSDTYGDPVLFDIIALDDYAVTSLGTPSTTSVITGLQTIII